VRKDGTRLWADGVIDLVRNPAGEVIGLQRSPATLRSAPCAWSPKNDLAAKVLIDNVVDYAIYLLDLDGTVKSWNPGAQRIKGYSAQEIIGANYSVFFTEDDVSAGEPIRSLEIARTTGRFEGTGWRVSKDGKRLWVNVVVDAVRDPAGAVIVRKDHARSHAERRLARRYRRKRKYCANTHRQCRRLCHLPA
jgi:PAS domain S-box-containing protein